MSKATLIRNFLQEEGSTIVSVKFIKKNGEKRTIVFNPKDRKELKGFGPNTDNPNLIRVRDFSIAKERGWGAWRSFNVNSIFSIRSRGQVYSFDVTL